jgi:hypothetical protein
VGGGGEILRGGVHPGDIVLGDQVAGSGIPRDLVGVLPGDGDLGGDPAGVGDLDGDSGGEDDLINSLSSLLVPGRPDRLVTGASVVGITGEDAGWLAGWRL